MENSILRKTRSDTLINWELANPVLLKAEEVLETSSRPYKRKIGNGVDKYKDLPYYKIIEELEDEEDSNEVTIRQIKDELKVLIAPLNAIQLPIIDENTGRDELLKILISQNNAISKIFTVFNDFTK